MEAAFEEIEGREGAAKYGKLGGLWERTHRKVLKKAERRDDMHYLCCTCPQNLCLLPILILFTLPFPLFKVDGT